MSSLSSTTFSNRDALRFSFDREHCAMLTGDCAGATARIAALHTRTGAPGNTAAQIDADYWCPADDPHADAATRKKRLLTQTSMFTIDRGACDRYVAPARAFAKSDGKSDGRAAAIVLTAVAKCMSINSRCQEAHELLEEARVFIPALNQSELTADCQ